MNGQPAPRNVEFELVEAGQGPAALLLPGSYATPAAWKGVQGALTSNFRTISTSLPGYGTTPEVRPKGDVDIAHLVDFVGQVVDAIGEPLHLVGHSWGAHILLAALLEQRIGALSLVCFEANPIFARPARSPFLWRTALEAMVDRFEAAVIAGEPDAASIIIDFYSAPGTFLGMPENVRNFIANSAPTNLLDWHSAATFTPAFERFSSFDIPVTLVRGSNTPAPVRDVNEHLAAHIPHATQEVVDGADHFLISTHAEACAEILDAHLAAM